MELRNSKRLKPSPLWSQHLLASEIQNLIDDWLVSSDRRVCGLKLTTWKLLYKKFQHSDSVEHGLAFMGQYLFGLGALSAVTESVDLFRFRYAMFVSMNRPNDLPDPQDLSDVRGWHVVPFVSTSLDLVYLRSVVPPEHLPWLNRSFTAAAFTSCNAMNTYMRECRVKDPEQLAHVTACILHRYYDSGDRGSSVSFRLPDQVVNRIRPFFSTCTIEQKRELAMILVQLYVPAYTERHGFVEDFLSYLSLVIKACLPELWYAPSATIRIMTFANFIAWRQYPESYFSGAVQLMLEKRCRGDRLSRLWITRKCSDQAVLDYIRLAQAPLTFNNPANQFFSDILMSKGWSISMRRMALWKCRARCKPVQARPHIHSLPGADILRTVVVDLPYSQGQDKEMVFNSDTNQLAPNCVHHFVMNDQSYLFRIDRDLVQGESVVSDIVSSYWQEAHRLGLVVAIRDIVHWGPRQEPHSIDWMLGWGAMTAYWLIRNGFLPFHLHTSVWLLLSDPCIDTPWETLDPELHAMYHGSIDYLPKRSVFFGFIEGFRRKLHPSTLARILPDADDLFCAVDNEITFKSFLAAFVPNALPEPVRAVFRTYTSTQLQRILKFITGKPRLPRREFGDSLISIAWCKELDLPLAQNCFNRWLLPEACQSSSTEVERVMRVLFEFDTCFVENEGEAF
jgi:hypothetical protein